MKNSIKMLTIASSLCSLLLISSPSYAGQDETLNPVEQAQAHQKKSEKRLAKLTKKLDLTESQVAQVREIQTQTYEQMLVLKPELQAYRKQVNTLTSNSSFDEQAYNSLRASYQDTLNSASLIKAKAKSAMKNVLTTEQFVKFEKMKKKFKQKNRNKRQES